MFAEFEQLMIQFAANCSNVFILLCRIERVELGHFAVEGLKEPATRMVWQSNHPAFCRVLSKACTANKYKTGPKTTGRNAAHCPWCVLKWNPKPVVSLKTIPTRVPLQKDTPYISSMLSRMSLKNPSAPPNGTSSPGCKPCRARAPFEDLALYGEEVPRVSNFDHPPASHDHLRVCLPSCLTTKETSGYVLKPLLCKQPPLGVLKRRSCCFCLNKLCAT